MSEFVALGARTQFSKFALWSSWTASPPGRIGWWPRAAKRCPISGSILRQATTRQLCGLFNGNPFVRNRFLNKCARVSANCPPSVKLNKPINIYDDFTLSLKSLYTKLRNVQLLQFLSKYFLKLLILTNLSQSLLIEKSRIFLKFK